MTDYVSLLRTAGLRPTRQRQSLARLLFADGNRHVTAEQLHGEAMAAGVRVSLATVYNTLHQFTRAALLREVMVDPGRHYFDTNTVHHHHYFREDDGQLIDIPGNLVQVDHVPPPPGNTKIINVDVVVRIRQVGPSLDGVADDPDANY